MVATPSYVTGHGLLDGKAVLVTAAAGTGIGFAAAKRCVEEGARVVISDKHERRLAESASALGVTGVEHGVGDELAQHKQDVVGRPFVGLPPVSYTHLTLPTIYSV